MTIRILISDRIADEGIKNLEEGFQVTRGWDKPKFHLPKIIDDYDVLIFRLKTKVRVDLLENANKLRVIGRAGAVLDVFEEAPLRRSKLLTLDNVIVIPHVGAQTFEAQQRASIQIANNIINALEKR